MQIGLHAQMIDAQHQVFAFLWEITWSPGIQESIRLFSSLGLSLSTKHWLASTAANILWLKSFLQELFAPMSKCPIIHCISFWLLHCCYKDSAYFSDSGATFVEIKLFMFRSNPNLMLFVVIKLFMFHLKCIVWLFDYKNWFMILKNIWWEVFYPLNSS